MYRADPTAIAAGGALCITTDGRAIVADGKGGAAYCGGALPTAIAEAIGPGTCMGACTKPSVTAAAAPEEGLVATVAAYAVVVGAEAVEAVIAAGAATAGGKAAA